MARGLVRGMLAGASAWGGLSPQIPTLRAEQLSGQAVCAFLTSYIRVPGGRGSWKRAGLVLRGVNPDFLSATEGATSSCSFGDAAETSTEIEAAQPAGLVSYRDSREAKGTGEPTVSLSPLTPGSSHPRAVQRWAREDFCANWT